MKKLKHALTYSARVIIGLIAGLTIAVTSGAETVSYTHLTLPTKA